VNALSIRKGRLMQWGLKESVSDPEFCQNKKIVDMIARAL
jgi:hypothetical protein